MMIVVLTRRGDAHLPYVARHLRQAELVVVDSWEIPEGVGLTCELAAGSVAVWWGGRRVDGAPSVWFRKPEPFVGRFEPGVDPASRDYVLSALTGAAKTLTEAFSRAAWVSRPELIRTASWKPGQLARARQLGLRVPEMVETSCPQVARDFVRAHGRCVAKSLATVMPASEDGRPLMFFTRAVGANDDFGGLALAPAIFQEAIDAAFNLRAVVVGQEVFCSRIDSAEPAEGSPVTDWRFDQAEDRVSFRPYGLDEQIARACVRLVKGYGLAFGAIDLIVDRARAVWFLEVNPNGQWAFVDEETTDAIGRALARLLEAPEAQRGL